MLYLTTCLVTCLVTCLAALPWAGAPLDAAQLELAEREVRAELGSMTLEEMATSTDVPPGIRWVGGLLGWWLGGWVAWWVGGMLGWWRVGWVACWVGGLVAWWRVGLVACWVGGLVGGWRVEWVACWVGWLGAGGLGLGFERSMRAAGQGEDRAGMLHLARLSLNF